MRSVERIVSGGQTGADRAALDVALALDIPCGGWVPAGRLDERGKIPAVYPELRETETPDPAQRTELNVRDSDGTLIISRGPLYGGSAETRRFAERLGKPWIHADLDVKDPIDWCGDVRAWIEQHRISVLNVAGPRSSEDPRIHRDGADLLGLLLRAGGEPAPEPADAVEA